MLFGEKTMRAAVLVVAGFAFGLGACSKGGKEAPVAGPAVDTTLAPLSQTDCSHAACGEGFFVDAAASGCVAGAACNVTLKLVATGNFHINEAYPYRFKADDAPGVDFLGTGDAKTNVFSKDAGDWRQTEAKSGTMTVKFRPHRKGNQTIAGTFKLSVCSQESCLLEQRQVSASVVAE
jgi:hypothetical protein